MKKDHGRFKETVQPGVFKSWQEVDVEIVAFTDFGIKVIINDEYMGLVYKNEVYDKYELGQKLKACIKFVREDGKIDVSLQLAKRKHLSSTADKVLKALKKAGGKLKFNDESSPTDIRDKFQVSKKAFKQAIGALYKQRKIKITDKGIEIIRVK